MKADRKYLLMTSKHSDKQHPLFWGERTEDGNPRSFGGYLGRSELAELYTGQDIIDHFNETNELIPMLPLTTMAGRLVRYTPFEWEKHTNSSDIFVITPEEVASNGLVH